MIFIFTNNGIGFDMNISFVNFKCNFSCIVTVYNLSGLFVVSANEMDMKWTIAICIVDIE